MKHTRIVSYVLAAGVAGFCAIGPRTAAAASFGSEDADKKPAPQLRIGNEEYRLGGGDKLRIEIYKDPQLSQSLQVRPDGKITLPLVGDVEAAGRTPLELRDIIAR